MRLKFLLNLILVFCLSLAPSHALAMSVFYDFACDNCAAIGDPGFSFSFEFSQAAVDAGSLLGIAGSDGVERTADDNILSAFISSGVGNGYINTLDDLIQSGGSSVNDRTDTFIAFSSDRQFIDDILDIGSGGDLLEFTNLAVGRTILSEGTDQNYSITLIQDLNPRSSDNLINVTGVFQRRVSSPNPNPIPEPSTILLLGSGMIGLVAWRHKYTKRR